MDDGSINYLGDWNELTIGYWNQSHIAPNMSLNIDAFSKAFYSTILTDLGQNSSVNLLTQPDGVRYLLSYLNTTAGEKGGGGFWNIHGIPEKATEPQALNTTSLHPSTAYDQLKDYMGPLGTHTPTLYFQYACSIPKRKDAGSLIVTILVADLVLLQAAWQILHWVAVFLLGRKDSNMNHCEACSTQEQQTAMNSNYQPLQQSQTSSKNAPSRNDEASSQSEIKHVQHSPPRAPLPLLPDFQGFGPVSMNDDLV